MSGDVVTWGAVAVAIGAVISIVTFWTRYSDRLTSARAKADEAIKQTEEAKQAAAGLQNDIRNASAEMHSSIEKTAADIEATATPLEAPAPPSNPAQDAVGHEQR